MEYLETVFFPLPNFQINFIEAKFTYNKMYHFGIEFKFYKLTHQFNLPKSRQIENTLINPKSSFLLSLPPPQMSTGIFPHRYIALT
jgi:hypothetical protein